MAGAAVGGLVSAAVEVTTQVIDGVKSGKSVSDSFKSVDPKKVAIEAAKGAVKGAIAGTGLGTAAFASTGIAATTTIGLIRAALADTTLGTVALALSNAVVDMAGEVATQTLVDGKEIQDINKIKVAETGIFSLGFSLTLGGVSKSVKNAISDKMGINVKCSELIQRERAINTVGGQIKKAKAQSLINKLTARKKDKIIMYMQTTGKYALNEGIKGVYGIIQNDIYKKN